MHALASFALISIAFASASTAHALPRQQMLDALNAKAGSYEMVSQDAARPCASSSFAPTVGKGQVQFSVRVQEQADEFYRPRDVIAALQYTSDEGAVIPLFDRPAFGAINGGVRRNLVIPIVISHESLFDVAANKLTHSVTLTSVDGGELALQTIQFTDDGFTYDYTIYRRNVLGYTSETIPADHCEFRRVR